MTSNDQQTSSTEDILKQIEKDKTSSYFKQDILAKGPAYQLSKTKPDMIEQVHADGTVLIGRFENGEFVPLRQR